MNDHYLVQLREDLRRRDAANLRDNIIHLVIVLIFSVAIIVLSVLSIWCAPALVVIK